MPASKERIEEIKARVAAIGFQVLRTGIESPRQSCTDFIPASRSRQTVSSAGSDFRSVVLPTPGGPKMARDVLFSAAESRSSAVMMRKAMGFSGV